MKRRWLLGARSLYQVAASIQVTRDFVGIMSWPPAHEHNANPGITKMEKILNEHINTHTSFCTGRLNHIRLAEQEEKYIPKWKFLKVFRGFKSRCLCKLFVCGQKTLNYKLKKHESWIRLYLGYIILIDVISALLFVSLLLRSVQSFPGQEMARV